jgi:putative component of membrane protein insertase Oxa1/YidC/SpoIIIJ protein YidD
MKRAALRAIEAWQANQNRPRGRCLRTPTCSVYGHQVISRHGVLRGAVMTAWRIFTCNGCLTAAPRRPAGRRAQ